MKSMFSVFDKKTGVYAAPFVSVNQGAAVRDFLSALNDPDTLLGKYPSDFDLFLLGEFDEESGVLSVTPLPTFVVNGGVLKESSV